MSSYNITRTVLLAFILAILAGCAANEVRVSDKQLAQLKNVDKINVIYHGPIGPALQTAGDAIAFQFTLGLAGWGTPGLQLMGENDIPDPLINLRHQLMQRLAAEGQLSQLSVGDSPAPYDQVEPADLRQLYGEGLHLQLLPGQWTIIYYVGDWTRYQMYYGVRARLIDTASDQILWSSFCQANQDEGDKAPNMEEMMANSAERIKQWAANASTQCANQLADHFLGQST